MIELQEYLIYLKCELESQNKLLRDFVENKDYGNAYESQITSSTLNWIIDDMENVIEKGKHL